MYRYAQEQAISTHIVSFGMSRKNHTNDLTPSGTPDVQTSDDGTGKSEPTSRFGRLIKRFGVAGFLFFLIKGVVLYILIPLGLFKWVEGC